MIYQSVSKICPTFLILHFLMWQSYFLNFLNNVRRQKWLKQSKTVIFVTITFNTSGLSPKYSRFAENSWNRGKKVILFLSDFCIFLSSFWIFHSDSDKMCENDGSIKIALCEVVTALMSPDPNERKLAEHQIDALQVTEGK